MAMANSNYYYFVGAAIFEVVGVVGTIIGEHFQMKKERLAIVKDLVKLNRQLLTIQKNVDELRELYEKILSKTNDSDSEFYEFSDNDDEIDTVSTDLSLKKVLKEFDYKVNSMDISAIRKVLDQLNDLHLQHSKNPEIMWRISDAYLIIALVTDDDLVKQEYINRAVTMCRTALSLNQNIFHVHRSYAMIVGLRLHSTHQSLRDKVKDGIRFCKHLDIAFGLNPNDSMIHHMKARYNYEVANLRWYEKKAIALILKEPPIGTFEVALEHCMESERLGERVWKENKLLMAQCQIELGRYKEAVDSLIKANNFDSLYPEVNNEVTRLLEKYYNSR